MGLIKNQEIKSRVGKQFDVTRERIRQIEAKAITGARRALRDRGIAAGDVAWA